MTDYHKHLRKESYLICLNPKKILVLAMVLFIFIGLTIGCKVGDPTSPEPYSYDKVYITAVSVQDTVEVDTSFPIKIEGDLPDPSWEFDHFDLFPESSILTITPIGKKDLSVEVTLTVVVPFEKTISYQANNIGLMQIHVIGRTRTLVSEVMVINK